VHGISIRPAHDDELGAVAELRWRWGNEVNRAPAVTQQEFVGNFVTWAQQNEGTHRCLVLLREDVLIGMAWLAITQRVPHPGALVRMSGDVQCVYVLPDERGGGLGGLLIEAVLAHARDLGLERVTVHSSDRAVSAYRRHGFVLSPRLLQVEATPSR
jgi:GNAT superfamily N-acetyltransferase